METNNDINFGETLLAVVSLLESAVTGNLLNNQPVDGLLFKCHYNLNRALISYLNNSTSSNDVGAAAFEELNKYVSNRQRIFDRKFTLDIADEFKAVKE